MPEWRYYRIWGTVKVNHELIDNDAALDGYVETKLKEEGIVEIVNVDSKEHEELNVSMATVDSLIDWMEDEDAVP